VRTAVPQASWLQRAGAGGVFLVDILFLPC